jgi:hypothetical protein
MLTRMCIVYEKRLCSFELKYQYYFRIRIRVNRPIRNSAGYATKDVCASINSLCIWQPTGVRCFGIRSSCDSSYQQWHDVEIR